MTVDVRSLKVAVPETFDFDSQAGILFLLRAIRVAPIDQTKKNSLKDLVFLYNTGVKDTSLKQKLEQTLSDFGVTPSVVAQEAAKTTIPPAVTVTPSGFSGGRLAPVFETVTPSVVHPVPAAKVMPLEPAVASISIPVRKIAPAIPQTSRPAIPTAAEPRIVTVAVPKTATVPGQAPVDVILPVKNPTPVEVIAPIVPIIPSTPAPVPEVILATPLAAETPLVTSEATVRMERIRSIKSSVNDRIGNPVNLVDVDNAVGREYMSALLEAMKLLSSASEAESAKAMNRLETVYAQVMLLLDTIKEQSQTQTPVSIPTPVSAFVPPATVSPIVPITPQIPVPVPASPSSTIESIVERVTPVTPASPTPTEDFVMRSKVVDKPQAPEPVSGWATSESTDLPRPLTTIESIPSVAQQVTPPDQIVVNRLSTPPAEPLRPVVAMEVPSYQPESVQSVTDDAPPLRSLSELKTADEVSAIEAMQNNPLYTKDVDSGLEQLLGEWSIFKKSGLFGTGPKGREHPLYVKINGMHLPLILAGRFEGSTQEIKQSITDYMNGWRYEQGIVYDQGETLDQYLRRVIRHIIDLQKAKRRS